MEATVTHSRKKKPSVEKKRLTEEEPLKEVKPLTEEKPSTEEEPSMEDKSSMEKEDKPSVEEKPLTEEEPLKEEKPLTEKKPSTEVEPLLWLRNQQEKNSMEDKPSMEKQPSVEAEPLTEKKLPTEEIATVTVSTVCNNDRELGKQNIFDGREDTCWSSDEGIMQWIDITLKNPYVITSFTMQFQGGFAGAYCMCSITDMEGEISSITFFPEDNNTVQKFYIAEPVLGKIIHFGFHSSSDFYGRVILYGIELFIKP